ncbi:PF07252 family protein [Staphylococcus aureus subsp. aureus 21252]|nr:PF07252 family protein [Staphylococcus aureus subsp. aureus 21252]
MLHKSKKEHYIETQEKRIDLYFKYNLNNYHSMKVTSFKKNPMGGYFIKGFVNNKKNYKFDAVIISDTNKQFKGDLDYKEDEIGELFREKNANDRLTVDEIIEKEHLDKSEYEAEPPLFFFSGPLE